MIELTGPASRFCDGQSRRSFLRAGFLGVAGLTLADFFRLKAVGRSHAQARARPRPSS